MADFSLFQAISKRISPEDVRTKPSKLPKLPFNTMLTGLEVSPKKAEKPKKILRI